MKSTVISFSILIFSLNCFSKDLTHRLGVGFKNSATLESTMLAVVYHSSIDFAMLGAVGFDTIKDYQSSQVLVGARYVIYPEANLNFYTAGHLSLVNSENPFDGKKSGVEVAALFGVEFFFAGLENLAFTAEGGLALSTVYNSRFRTVGDSPLRAGMIFYF